MDVTSIQVEAGFTMNAGDYQSVKATIAMRAELGRGEDVDAATSELRAKVMQHLIGTATSAHPDAARKLLAGGKGQAAIAAPKTETAATDKKKPGPKPKEKTNGSEALLSDTEDGMNVGGLDKEDQLGAEEPGLGGDEDLLGGEEVVEITRESLTAKLRDVLKAKGQPALTQLFKKVGSADLKSTPQTKYQELYALAVKALA